MPCKKKRSYQVTSRWREEPYTGILRIRSVGVYKKNPYGFKNGQMVRVTIRRMKA